MGPYAIMAHKENDGVHKAHIKQLAHMATIPHLGASIMFGKTVIYDAQWQVTLT